jgi:Xaa-Pro aminopeptidase
MSDTILTNIQNKLIEGGSVAIIVSSPDNVTYLAGYEIPSQVFPIRERLIVCAIAASGQQLMLVPDMEYSLATSQSRMSDVRMYNEFTQNPIDELISILKEYGIHSSDTIAVEDDFLPGVFLDRLQKNFPAKYIPAKPIMTQLRLIKTVSEIDKLRKVNKIAEKAHFYAAQKARAGLSELQYAQYIYEYVFSNGAESLNKLVVGSGERSEHGNANPTERIFQPGDIIRTDIFAKIGGYQSDVARTAVVGKPTQKQQDTWKKIIEARELVLQMIQPGQRTQEIFKVFSDYFVKAKLTPINFVGHGLGITLHEDPYISRYHDGELLPGMVLAIEPLYLIKGEGYQVEEIVAVTQDGYELITNSHDVTNLIEIKLKQR